MILDYLLASDNIQAQRETLQVAQQWIAEVRRRASNVVLVGIVPAPAWEHRYARRLRQALRLHFVTQSVNHFGRRSNEDETGFSDRARERGFRTMFDNGLNKAQRGLTTLEEVLRATQQ